MTDKDAIRKAAEEANNDIYDYRRSGGEASPDGIIGIIEQAIRVEVERERERCMNIIEDTAIKLEQIRRIRQGGES